MTTSGSGVVTQASHPRHYRIPHEEGQHEAIRGVIFDMDGTLTLPVIDFDGLRKALNIPRPKDILVEVQKYPPQEVRDLPFCSKHGKTKNTYGKKKKKK